MDLRQLRSLVAVADELHFTRAASRVAIAQPALSKQIRLLEQELDVPLVDRTTRRVVMTEAGELLVGRARRVLAELDAARDELLDLKGLATGRVVVGLTPTPGPVDVTALLSSFHAAHPGVSLVVREALSADLVGHLEADAVDVAFMTRPRGADLQRLDVRSLASERLVAVVPRGHRFAHRRRLRLADLADEAFVAYPPGATIRELVWEEAARAGFIPNVAFEAGEVMRVRSFVAAGLGVGILPHGDAASPGPAVAAVALAGPALRHEVLIATRAGRRLGPAARAFFAAAAGV